MRRFSDLFKIAPTFICAIFSIQSLSGSIPSDAILITTSNLPSEISQKFSLKKILTLQDQYKLPEEFRKLVIATHEFDYYYAISPTKGSGGYIFEIEKSQREYKICLREPKPMSAMTTALTTPIALIKVQKGVKIDSTIIECK